MTNQQPVDPREQAGLEDPADSHQADADEWTFPVVGVGASAGGLDAFTQLLKALPTDTGMAFVLVQHLAPAHPSSLTEILSRATSMPVQEVVDEAVIEPNQIYVIPPDRSMTIERGTLQLFQRESGTIHRPVDQFFRSLAAERRHLAIGVVLSGTATDGTLGLQEIKAEGGITFAQDASAQQEGMPHSAIASGCVDFVLSPREIALELARISRHPYAVTAAESAETEGRRDLAQVVTLLHHATGVDFSNYKFNTLYRRVTRRMIFLKQESLSDYVQYLRKTPAELDELYQDILISVTSFFRDPESFEVLKRTVFPRLLHDRSRHDPIRLWTLGCSTGQEAYSLAMAFAEVADALGSHVPLQVFATDLNHAGIEKARASTYPKEIAQDVSPERLRRFFTEVDGQYRVSKAIRDMCVFSRHNVLADPPFSRIDLISCRNLLIYLDPVLQQRVVPLLHYALKPGGGLWLGSSETIGAYRNLFEVEDAKHKVYVKKPGSTAGHNPFLVQRAGARQPTFAPAVPRLSESAELHREADRLLSAKFAPPGVLVTPDLEILQYRGDTSPYLAPAPGKASLNLLKMLREGLLVAVRAAALRAAKSEGTVRQEGLRVLFNGQTREIAVEVIFIRPSNANKGGFLILFEDSSRSGRSTTSSGASAGAVVPSASTQSDSEDALAPDANNVRLSQELEATREFLQSVIEQQEAANEELQSSNEEVQSANEELQSTNEELETSKEEIQSSNEELATVNDELNNRNTELDRVNNDLVNLLGSVQTAIVMLGSDLRVRRYTPMAEKLLNLIPTDVGRPLADIKLNLEGLPDLEPLLAEVIDTVTAKEIDVRDKRGRWYALRLHPCKTRDNRIDGVVVMLVDVDVRKRALAFTESIVATVREPLLVLDKHLNVQVGSRQYYEMFRVTPEDTEQRLLFELGNGQWDIPDLRRLLEKVLPRDNQVSDFEVEREFEHLGKRTMMLNARRLVQATDQEPLILLAIEDVSERTAAETALRESHARFEAVFDTSPVGMYLVDAQMRFRQMSRKANEAFGSTGSLIGGKFVDVVQTLWAPHVADDIVAHFRHTLETGESYVAPEFIEERYDRKVREYYDWQIHRIAMPDGQFGVVCYFIDISARVLAEMSLRETERNRRLIMDSMPQMIVTAKPNGEMDYFSPQWIEFTGLSYAEIRGWGWKQFIHPDDLPETIQRWQQSIETGDPFVIEHRLRPGDGGEPRWHLTRTTALRDAEGRIEMWIGSSTDIHQLREATNQLQLLAADLSEADRRKNEFLAMLAHELRNPLAPIRNAVQVLRLAEGGGDAVRSASEMMERQVSQMVRLVDDLLDVSRISRGKIELRRERVELAAILEHAAEATRAIYGSKNHELDIALPPRTLELNADASRLAQVVENLLNNACKFTPDGGRIELTVAVEAGGIQASGGSDRDTGSAENSQRPDVPRTAVLSVRDTGIGIAADHLPHIFELFMQLDNSLERSAGGLGIGLALVKKLVELHGGTVEAHSAGLGHGSEFVVRLPIPTEAWLAESRAKNTAGSVELAALTAAPAVKRRILVVDDNHDSATTLATLMGIAGHETQTAYDGLQAVSAAGTFRPDVVLLDIGLPKLNGHEVARKIREQPWGAKMVLIAMTGWGHADDRRKSQEAGFDGHLVKPVAYPVLVKLLTELLPTRT